VVAIAPSGLDVPPERAVQATGMVLAGAVARLVRAVAGPLTRSPLGRTLLLANLRARPWAATPQEAQAAVDGFGAPDFYRLLLWSTVLDVPVRPRRAPCPVVLVQGTFDWVSLGQVPRWLLLLPGSRFRVLPWAGHEPLSDVPDRIVRLALDTIARAGPDRSSRAQAHR
jgi:pimeloyl-ACP methyl ester carboxylesterase